jgi:hypothetical protein
MMENNNLAKIRDIYAIGLWIYMYVGYIRNRTCGYTSVASN